MQTSRWYCERNGKRREEEESVGRVVLSNRRSSTHHDVPEPVSLGNVSGKDVGLADLEEVRSETWRRRKRSGKVDGSDASLFQLTSDERLEEDLEDGGGNQGLNESHSSGCKHVNTFVSDLNEKKRRREVSSRRNTSPPFRKRTYLEESDKDEGDQKRQSGGE